MSDTPRRVEADQAEVVLPPRHVPAALHWGQTTRRGGVSDAGYASLNLASHCGDDLDSVASNWQRLAEATGWTRARVATCRQVHGVAIEDVVRGGAHDLEADALVTAEAGVAVGVFTADCVPVLIACPGNRVAAAVHCGWRGAAGELAARTVEHLREHYGADPGGLLVHVGAAIAQCSYEVGTEVATRFGEGLHRPAPAKGKYLLDVRGAVLEQLAQSGVPAGSVSVDARDTFAERELFFSYRRDGAATGRMLAYVGWR